MGEIATIHAQPVLSSEIVESIVLDGDLGRLSPAQRVAYYVHRCESLGIDPGEKPFDLIRLNGKLTLYASKTCTNALTRVHKLSVEIKSTKIEGTLVIVEARAKHTDGRFVDDVGVLDLDDEKKLGKPNAIMKCVTKAKRRAVLSLVGLGMLDDTEVGDIRGAQRVDFDASTGEVMPARGGQVVDVAVVPQAGPADRVDLGPRCIGDNGEIAIDIDTAIAELCDLAGITSKGKAWGAALRQAGVVIAKYEDTLRGPESLTVADGRLLLAYLDGRISERMSSPSADQDQDTQPTDSEAQ